MPTCCDAEQGVIRREVDVAEKFVWLRPGVAMPDWSLVTEEAARQALAAMSGLGGFLARLTDIEPIEDGVWRAILEGYAEAGCAPVTAEIITRTGLDPESVRGALRQLRARDLVVLDASGEAIMGAYPFTETATPHRVHLGARTLNAMCAIDALGAGAMYGEDIHIDSACHQCGQPIAINTRDRGFAIEAAVPGETVVWAGLRYANGCAATSLCKVLAFFCSDAHLESWRRVHAPTSDDGMRLTLAEAMQVGKALFVPGLAPATHGDGA